MTRPTTQKSRTQWIQPSVGHGKVVVLMPGMADAYKTTYTDYTHFAGCYPVGTQVWIDGIEVPARVNTRKETK